MTTQIRAVISEKNKYWIDKHRHYELRHFCLQYPSWKKAYSGYSFSGEPTSIQTSMQATKKIKIVEKAALEADDFLSPYILKAVTEGLSYTYLRTKMEMPCGRDTYYDRYRRFFWLLNEARDRM